MRLFAIEEVDLFQTATYVGPNGGTTTVSDHGFRALPNDPYVKLSRACPRLSLTDIFVQDVSQVQLAIKSIPLQPDDRRESASGYCKFYLAKAHERHGRAR
jgi:hypothetical protein